MTRMIGRDDFSVDKLALHVEDQGGVGWNVGRRPLGSVGQGRRNGEPTLSAHPQTSHTDVPALETEEKPYIGIGFGNSVT